MFNKLFETYLKEKLYLGGLSPRTLNSYVDVKSGAWFKNDDGLIQKSEQGMLLLFCVPKQSLVRTVHH